MEGVVEDAAEMNEPDETLALPMGWIIGRAFFWNLRVQFMFRLCLGFTLAILSAAIAPAEEPTKSETKPETKPNRPATGMSPEAIVDMLLQRMDTNKDGKISRSEARNRIADNFDAIDTNKDGFLDRKELLALAKRIGQMPPLGRPGGLRPDGAFGPRPNPLDFDALDKNADGRLTREELRGTRFADLFDAIDQNKDGRIDPDEWNAYHKIKR